MVSSGKKTRSFQPFKVTSGPLSYSALPAGITILDGACVIFIGAASTNTQTFALSSSKHLVALRVVWFRLKIFFFLRPVKFKVNQY